MNFGDPITNICAGESNPHRLCYFVRRKRNTIECTDKRGDFWEIDKSVITSGHLSVKESNELFKPIWEEKFGNKK